MIESWQYQIKQKNKKKDLIETINYFSFPRDFFNPAINISKEELCGLVVNDFDFNYEEKRHCYEEIKEFINKHEWLGKMSPHPTHIFTARYKGLLCGVVVMDMPNAFSKMLGKGTKNIERLISRGACISFSPKNLASTLIMFAVRWMVSNTDYRLFTCYADPKANELGTIYQACNFFYLGDSFGTNYQYKIENGNWVSDRYFRRRSVYKRVAKKNGIVWNPRWQGDDEAGNKILFDKMPIEIALKIKTLAKQYMERCESKKVPSKHKYAYILGNSKKETKQLKSKFLSLNKIYPYPKIRGI